MLGAYFWEADLSNGETVSQWVTPTEEQSVDVLRDQSVVQIRLFPRTERHPMIVLDIQEDEAWLKYWTRTFQLNLDTDARTELPAIDVLGLHSPRPVRMFIYHDGSIRLTSATEG